MSMVRNSEITPFQAWLLAIRPRTLPAAVSPVAVGTALAVSDGVFAPLPAAAALVGAVLIQVGANLTNDYFDYVNGVDTPERQGPQRAAQSGLIALPRLRLGITVVFAITVLVGAYLISIGGWPILAIGLASLLSSLAYTGGPIPIGYYGLGDLFVFLFFGVAAVSGTFYVQALSISLMPVVASIPVGMLTVAILVVNNLRDIKTDQQTGKRTLAVMIGPKASRLEYTILLAVAYTVPTLLWLSGKSSAWVLLPWLSMPLAVRLVHDIHRHDEGPSLNRALAATARLDLIFCTLFAAGLLL